MRPPHTRITGGPMPTDTRCTRYSIHYTFPPLAKKGTASLRHVVVRSSTGTVASPGTLHAHIGGVRRRLASCLGRRARSSGERGQRASGVGLGSRGGRRGLAGPSGGRCGGRRRRVWETGQMGGVPGPAVSQTVRCGTDAPSDSHRRREPTGRLRAVSLPSHADVVALSDARRRHATAAVVGPLVGLLSASNSRRHTVGSWC